MDLFGFITRIRSWTILNFVSLTPFEDCKIQVLCYQMLPTFFEDFEACPVCPCGRRSSRHRRVWHSDGVFFRVPPFSRISIIPPILLTRLYLRAAVTRRRNELILGTPEYQTFQLPRDVPANAGCLWYSWSEK